ncbi:CLUMA_CG004102, isoform A [Clunio marinus]|uniref:CLUMA_CG004102, isoform A n=1 Tax=Clunio marinus TaxID=568069 RepID=A0A1J1HRY0_9DIPT|nr:CLUMA_CG004102, isoform A [Clunio marinus]
MNLIATCFQLILRKLFFSCKVFFCLFNSNPPFVEFMKFGKQCQELLNRLIYGSKHHEINGNNFGKSNEI